MKKIISVIFISLLLVSLAAPAALASNLPSWYPEDWREAALELELAAFPDGVDFYMSKPIYIEIVSREANKANALKALAEAMRIPRENILAFGDGQNDIAMLEYAGTGCAVANASEEVRRRADRVVPANTEDGVAQEIERLLAAGEIGRRKTRP